MTKKLRLTALIGAGLFLLTGCGGRESDLSKRYSAYFKYAYGENFTFTYRESNVTELDGGKQSTDDWYDYSYTDANGETVEDEFAVEPYSSYTARLEPGEEKESKEAYDYAALDDLMRAQLRSRTARALYQQYIRPQLDTSLFCSAVISPVGDFGGTDAAAAAERTLTQKDTGLRFCEDSLETLLQDDRLCTSAELLFPADEDPSAEIENFRGLAAEFRALGVPNYWFIMKQKTESGTDEPILFYEYSMLGEVTEYDPDTEPEYVYEYQFRDALREAYPAK